MKIAIAGAGLGGLSAAHGLLGAGHDVTVYEKHATIDRGLGYRMRLDRTAADTLRMVLPARVWTALLASSASAPTIRRRRFTDHRLVTFEDATDHVAGSLFLGPGPLRRILTRGLDERVRWSHTVVDYDVRPGGTTVVLSDGSTDEVDLLVIAEGAHSRLRARLTGDADQHRSGYASIAARVSGRARPLGMHRLAQAVDESVVLASGPHRVMLFLAAHDPELGTVVDPVAAPEWAEREEAYLVWSVIAPESRIPMGAPADELTATAMRLLHGWHPDVHRLVGATADPPATTFRLYAGESMPTWPTTTVTLLGDAVHPIPPTGGIGGSTAIRDAGHLVAALRDVRDRPSLLTALHEYEATVRGYADDVVAGSVAPLRLLDRMAAPPVHAAVTRARRASYRVRAVRAARR